MTFLGLLGILFIGLKLVGFIDWSWWFVLMPIWFSPLLIGMIVFIGGYMGLKFKNTRK